MQPARMMDGGAMTFAGMARSFTVETRGEIPALWRGFGPRIAEVKSMIGRASYGISQSMLQPGGTFTYMAAVQVADTKALPAGFTAMPVPPRKYAVFAHEQHVSAISHTIMQMVDRWLPSSGFRIDGEPVLIEVYSEAFDPATGMGGMEIWLPVKP